MIGGAVLAGVLGFFGRDPRRILMAAGGLGLLLGAWWLDARGYGRAQAECRAAAEQQERRIDEIRRDFETRWSQEADRLALKEKEYDDALAAIDAAADGDAAGGTVCLAGDGLRALKAIR